MYVVHPFEKKNPPCDCKLMELIDEFTESNFRKVLVVIHPTPEVMRAEELEVFIDCLNEQISGIDLVAFGFHPNSSFKIQEVYTRKTPYIICAVQSQSDLKRASDILSSTNYYDNWMEDDLKSVGLPRT